MASWFHNMTKKFILYNMALKPLSIPLRPFIVPSSPMTYRNLPYYAGVLSFTREFYNIKCLQQPILKNSLPPSNLPLYGNVDIIKSDYVTTYYLPVIVLL